MMPESDRGCVTVSRRGRLKERERAEWLARRIGLPFRRLDEAGGRRLVLERAGIHLETEAGIIRSHPGMGLVRLRRLVRGEERDLLLDLVEPRPGEHVLDATFGFGQDALVLAHGVGREGRVTALEASPLLAGLALDGMPRWPAPADQVSKRIDLLVADAREWLKIQADRSFDVVYLDPMFRFPKSAAPDFVVLRALAEPAPLDSDLLSQARRVARRRVVVKDAWPGRVIGELGLRPQFVGSRPEIVFGVIDLA